MVARVEPSTIVRQPTNEDVGRELAAALAWLHARALELEKGRQVPEPAAESEPAEGEERQP